MDSVFEEIYLKLIENCKSEVNKINSKKYKILLTILLSLLVANMIIVFLPNGRIYLSLSIPITIALMLLFLVLANNYSRDNYKDVVIRNLVKLYDNKMYFDSKAGITQMDYKASNYDKKFNQYSSEDRIYGKIENGSNFQMSQVNAKDVHTNYYNGHSSTESYDTFSGLYGIIRLEKNIMSKINVESDSHSRKYNKNRIEVDSAEFEKYYDLLADDRILALKIFTPELIEKFNELKRDNKHRFELKIIEDKVYFRYWCGRELFEPPSFKSSLDKEMLRKYFKIFYYPVELSKSLVININNIF